MGSGGWEPHCLLPDKVPRLVTVESLSMYAPVSEHIPAPWPLYWNRTAQKKSWTDDPLDYGLQMELTRL